MADYPVPQTLLTPMNFPRKLLMGPGPSNSPPRVLAASALPLLGHLHPEFCKIMDEVKAGIQYAFQTNNKLTLAVSGTGHAAMEAAATNLIEKGDVVLVAATGIWGDRFGEMAERHEADVRKFVKPQGDVFRLSELDSLLERTNPSLMFVTHGESSSATLQPLEGLGDLCHKHNCLLVVDSVAAMGGVPLYMDRWGIDVLYSGAQKVLSVPPGASPISFSDRAWNVIRNRKTKVRSFYFDMNWLGNYWACEEGPRKYHHTGPISNIFALREGLAMLCEEGLEHCWKRHQECAYELYQGVEAMGLSLFVTKPANRLPTVTAINVPRGVDWKKVCDFAMNKYKIEISGGLGPSAGKVWRVGLMGYNANKENVHLVLRALKEGVEENKPASKL